MVKTWEVTLPPLFKENNIQNSENIYNLDAKNSFETYGYSFEVVHAYSGFDALEILNLNLSIRNVQSFETVTIFQTQNI